MSDDDLIRRGDAILSVNCALNRGVMEQRLRSLPAVPPAAERLPRRATAEMLVAAVDAACAAGSTVEDVVNAALRAASPASTGAAPPAADPAIFQKPPGSLDEAAVRGNNPEPEAEPAPCGTCGGLGRAVPHKPGCPNIAAPQFGEWGRLSFCGKCETMRDVCPDCRPEVRR